MHAKGYDEGRKALRRKTRSWMRTLGEEAGYHRHRLSALPSTSALIVIDMQRFFLEPNEHAFIPAGLEVLPNVVRLREAFRERGMRVLYTRHGHTGKTSAGQMSRWWADLLMASDPLAEIVPELRPGRGEAVIRKQYYDAFKDTRLKAKLDAWGITHLVVTGVMTHLCCETTARAAFMNDLEVVMTVDGTATRDDGVHLASLTSAAHGFAVPLTVDEVIDRLDAGGGKGQ